MVLVLLVDNDPSALARCAHTLLGAGHQVCTEQDGQAALDEIEWNSPDIVICDGSVTTGDGWGLVRSLRDDERTKHLPILFMSAIDDKEHRLAAFREGVDDYLPKPFEPEELVQRVDRVVGRSSVAGRPPSAPPSSDVQGRLRNFRMKSVLKLIDGENKSGTLSVARGQEWARFWFKSGVLVKATGRMEAAMDWQSCLLAALSWTSGDFWFVEEPVEMENEINVAVADLLAGGLHPAQYGRRA